ncbi:MAG: hypothetical protein HRU10_05850, partial [Opitutales bacterium]|nr:hypothetical protein [Opitutales bacterium]
DTINRYSRSILTPDLRHQALWDGCEENRISFSKLQVLLADGDFVYARDGLEEGDLICLTSPQSLYSGTLVSWEADTE